jgi:hypothetical protein
MSLVTQLNSGSQKAGTSTPPQPTAKTALGGLLNTLTTFGRYLVHVFDAIAEARVHRAMVEAELYKNRYLHSSKNDDDLPIVR